jgi:putative addiction module CopG family antidote
MLELSDREAIMNIPLDPTLDAFVQKKVRSGQYASAIEVVEGALKLMKDIDELPHEPDIDELRHELREAIGQADRGQVEEWNLANAQARLLERLASRKRAN